MSERQHPKVQFSNALVPLVLVHIVSGLFSTNALASGRGSDLPFSFVGGNTITEVVNKQYDGKNPAKGSDDLTETDTTIGFKLDFAINAGFASGGISLDGFAQASKSNFVHRLGDRLHSTDNSSENIQVYSFNAAHIGDAYDFNFFYHVPRYHWGYEGDYFGLLEEVTDMAGQDIWNDKAPNGVEFVGKGGLEGLKVVSGKEIYWGAKAQTMVKYQFGEGKRYAAMFAQEHDSQARKASLQGDFDLAQGLKLRLGGLISGNDKVGQRYDYYQDGKVYESTITTNDIMAAKGRLTYDLSGSTQLFASLHYAGLVADGGAELREFGTQLPYSGLGNKQVLELGTKINVGTYMFMPRLMLRNNLRDANTVIPHSTSNNTINPGLALRNTTQDPFAVLGNRKVRAAEFLFTSDPTPGTYFYEWDNDAKEDAPFAYDVSFLVMDYQGTSDSSLNDGDLPIGEAQAAERLWKLRSKMVFNTSAGLNTVVKLETGKQQGNKSNKAANQYASIEAKLIHRSQNIYTVKYAKDKFGRYDYHRDYATRYPQAIELGYERLIESGKSADASTKIGIKGFYRTLDEHSGGDWAEGANSSMREIQAYAIYKF